MSEMAEIAASFVRPAIEVVKWIGAPIIRQFNYLCCFTANIVNLKYEAQKLDHETGDLQRQVDRARDDVPEVETWITAYKEIMDEMNAISNEATSVGSGCFKLRDRFSLSKRAKRTTDCMKALRGQCNFNIIAHPRPPAAAEAIPLGTTYEFQSRKQIEEDIMTSLRGGDVNIIGICGMGGLGKTTMAKIIMNRALKEHVFEEVVMVVVGQPVDELKIQVDIGEPLGLNNLKEEASMANRVQKLHSRLTEGTKRILLVLDDVWERLVIIELGIPRGCKNCTILLTSRNQDVLRAMNVEKVFGMKVLTKEEAWFLFRETAGTCVDDIGLNSAAKEVVEECRGLPIALTTVGSALKDENDKCIWKDAVTQLRKASPNNIPDFIKEVYNPLRESYDKLESQQAKSVFLLCCLFGEDANIPLNYLTYFCMGLGIFEGDISNLEQARNRMCVLIKMLKSRSLLLDGLHDEDCVRMHDVVRDVSIFIAKEKGYIGGNDCTWISSFQTTAGERIKLPINLRLLFLSHNYSKHEEEINKFNDCYVEGIRDLQVLFIENYSSLTSLPHTTESLRNLKTLVLNSCPKLETISFVGESVNLEILICRDCDSIKELPPEIKRLNCMKLLDLTGCGNLERIGGGIISSLVGLEELKMLGSFNKWEASDSTERENAKLRELEALINLRCLEIDIDDRAAEITHLSSKLERFHIRYLAAGHHIIPKWGNKKLSLQLDVESCLGDWIEMRLLPDAECLHLTGNGAKNVDYLAKSENIRWLDLGECETMKNLGRTSMDDVTVFPSIEHLSLFSLPELEEIWDGPIPSDSFRNLNELSLKDLPTLKQFWKNYNVSVFTNLSSIEISRCPSLHNLGQLSIAGHDCLARLQILSIEECEMMEQVFLWNEEDDQRNIDTTIVFSKLKSVILKSLPNLSSLCKGIESFKFPQLAQILVEDCPVLLQNIVSINLFSKSNKAKMLKLMKNQPFRNAEYLSLEGDSYRNLDFRKVQNMHWLTFRECSMGPKLVNVTTMDTLFPQLEVLRLVKLTELEEIWNIDGPIPSNYFKNLKELRLEFLPALKHFWQSSSSPSQMNAVSIFNKLSSLHVYGCHKLSNLFSLRVTETDSCLLQLEELVVESCDMMEQVFFLNEGDNGRNIHIPKLKILILDSLPQLTFFCKGIESFEFPSLVRQRISRCPLLKNFVSTGWSPDDHGHDIHLFCKPDNKVQEKMELKLQGNISLGSNKIQECVEYMSLEGDGSTRSDFGVAKSIRCLAFREFPMGTKLMNMTTIVTLFPWIKVLAFRECLMGTKLMNMTTIATPFPHVEVLCLVNIKELEEISDIDGPKNLNELRLKSLPALKHLRKISSSPSQMNAVSIFNKLSCIYIYECHSVFNLFSLSMTATGSCVLQLERLVIESCDMMEQVFLWNEEKNINVRESNALNALC